MINLWNQDESEFTEKNRGMNILRPSRTAKSATLITPFRNVNHWAWLIPATQNGKFYIAPFAASMSPMNQAFKMGEHEQSQSGTNGGFPWFSAQYF